MYYLITRSSRWPDRYWQQCFGYSLHFHVDMWCVLWSRMLLISPDLFQSAVLIYLSRSAILSSYRNIDWHNGTSHVGNVQLASSADVEFCICTSVQGQCLFGWTVLLLLFLILLLINYFYLFVDLTNYQLQNQHYRKRITYIQIPTGK
jgi:hypothetical protein